MKILMCHNYYQVRGGEDEVFEVEGELLRENGHEVVTLTLNNDTINQRNAIATGLGAIWNHRSYQQVKDVLETEKPDLVHFYNTFPLFSPSVYYAVKEARLPLVQSVHNYRMLCLNATLYRAESNCEDCVGKLVPLPGIRHGCYRNSSLQSIPVAAMQLTHRLLKSWHRKVDIFLLGSTHFAVEKFAQAGFSRDAFMLKPNFVHPDPGVGSGSGGYALFVGRLDETKGINELLEAWESKKLTIPLKIIGDGPLAPQVEEIAKKSESVEWLGRKSLDEMYTIMKSAVFLVFPSLWYEAMPRTIIDSFAVGTPVCASDIGAMRDLVEDGRTGLLFKPSDASDLAEKVDDLFHRPDLSLQMREFARDSYTKNYTAEINYDLIMKAYERAIERNNKIVIN